MADLKSAKIGKHCAIVATKWTCPQSVLSKSNRRRGRQPSVEALPYQVQSMLTCCSTAFKCADFTMISPEEVERFAPDTAPMQLFPVLCCFAYGCLWMLVAFFLRLLCFQWRPVDLESSNRTIPATKLKKTLTMSRNG